MSTTVTAGGGYAWVDGFYVPAPEAATVIEPLVVDGWDATRESQNIVHTILGRPAPDVTIRPARLRKGTLRMVFAAEADAVFAVDTHTMSETFTVSSTERDGIGMTYVTSGRIGLSLDDTTRDVWVVEVDYQEIAT